MAAAKGACALSGGGLGDVGFEYLGREEAGGVAKPANGGFAECWGMSGISGLNKPVGAFWGGGDDQ